MFGLPPSPALGAFPSFISTLNTPAGLALDVRCCVMPAQHYRKWFLLHFLLWRRRWCWFLPACWGLFCVCALEMKPAGLEIRLLAFRRADCHENFWNIWNLNRFVTQAVLWGALVWEGMVWVLSPGEHRCPCVWLCLSLCPTAGSYVALTVQGRPPGSPQIPLADSDVDLAAFGHMSPIMASPHSPGTSGNAERITSPVLMGVSFEALFPKGQMEPSSGLNFLVLHFRLAVGCLSCQWVFIHLWKSILWVKIPSLIE